MQLDFGRCNSADIQIQYCQQSHADLWMSTAAWARACAAAKLAFTRPANTAALHTSCTYSHYRQILTNEQLNANAKTNQMESRTALCMKCG